MKRKKKFLLILVILLLIITSDIKVMKTTRPAKRMVTAQVFAASAPISQPETKAQLQEITSVADADTLKNYFENKNHSEFLPVALVIENSCKNHDLSFETVLAIAIFESGYGESDIAKQKQNFFGIGAYDEASFESASDFSALSLERAIDEQICILEKDYFDRYQTLNEISKVYCRNSEFWLEEIKIIQDDIIKYKKEEVLK